MLLILTNSEDATADYLVSIFSRDAVSFCRFDTDKTLSETSFRFAVEGPELSIAGERFRPNDFRNVWYRRPERLKHPDASDSPESTFLLDEWSEALEGFLAHIPRQRWMNHPAANVGASHKIEQLTTAGRLGLAVPDTLVTHSPDELRTFFSNHNGRVIVKPLSVGYLERKDPEQDSLIYTNVVTANQLDTLSDLPSCPTLFQEYIDKLHDVRITVVDSELHAVSLRAADSDGQQLCDIRRNNMEGVAYERIGLPPPVEHGIKTIVGHYGLRFAAIDMVVSREGKWLFLEVNPNGQ
jgi:hypothetical protein